MNDKHCQCAIHKTPLPCGCCEGTDVLTPAPTANRPSLGKLVYRIGVHPTFLETMKARLFSLCLGSAEDCRKGAGVYPLRKLTVREADDPASAMLDAWATVADVMTFYQERIANEGYLRTATERRSILELARLVGYAPRPGVASTVYLAWLLDDKFEGETTIPAGSLARSAPGPGEEPQAFETSEPIKARAVWNALQPRMFKPQNITLGNVLKINAVYFEGTATNLKTNDSLLFVFGDGIGEQVIRAVKEVIPKFDSGMTEVKLQEVPFLIHAAADLLQVAIAMLAERIAAATTPALKGQLEAVQESALEALGQLFLGNYPPLHTHNFNRARIYGFLGKSVGMATATARKKTGKTQAVEVDGIFGSRFPTFTANFANAPSMAIWIEVVTKSLGDASFRNDLICFARIFFDQARPASSREREILRTFLGRFGNDDFIPGLLKQIGPLSGLQPGPLVNELAILFGDEQLKRAFGGLLNDLEALSENNRLKQAIGIVKTWLAGIQKQPDADCGSQSPAVTSLDELTASLIKPVSVPPASRARLPLSTGAVFSRSSDNIARMAVNFQPGLKRDLYDAWANASVRPQLLGGKSVQARSLNAALTTAPPELKTVQALRLVAPPFGYNAPVKMALKKNTDTTTNATLPFIAEPDGDWAPQDERPNRLYLDNAYDAILPGSYLVIRTEGSRFIAARVEAVKVRPRTAYSISAKTTQLNLNKVWRNPAAETTIGYFRRTMVFAQGDDIKLAQAPEMADVSGNRIELQVLTDGLDEGRWLIVSGERTDIPGTQGVKASELMMLAAVDQTNLPGDKTRSVITLANSLAHTYKRDTVGINANVAKATNGETRQEILGSGDGSKALQQFTLKQPPLTFVSASNPSGVESTLKVYVNDVHWRESDTLAGLGRADRRFITKADDEAKTTMTFGNGREGARLPSGVENIRATYRFGIGRGGNVRANQISILGSRPLGVKEVINPLPASGGADREGRDQARKNAPLAVLALDRLVSTQDYADFARTFAGIGKAAAARLSDGRQQIVHLTIAGAGDIPIEATSDLYRNLLEALSRAGDPYQPFQVVLRELILLVISAGVRIHRDYLWEKVEEQVRATLIDAFSFERRELGQDALLSEVLSVMQCVPGVEYVDVDVFGGVPEKQARDGKREFLPPSEIAKIIAGMRKPTPDHRVLVNLAGDDERTLRPAQLAYLTPEVPATLILNEVKR